MVSETEAHQWTVGELAGAAGVTVRTLHHYDHLGLLAASERSEGGHRRYSADDVAQLYRILALRDLGFGLEEIGSLLAGDGDTAPLDVTRLHLERVERQLNATARLRQRLSRIQAALERSDDPSAELLIDAMEAMTTSVSLDRIITKQGDGGETQLGDMTPARKDHPRVHAGGAVDELNAHLGVALALGVPDPFDERLGRIQNELFDLGADVAVPDSQTTEQRVLRITAAYVSRLEDDCREANKCLEPVDSFVLPGGSAQAAQLHVCRTVCRRAEREAVKIEGLNNEVVRYLNRLSDLLFMLSRVASADNERLWQPGGPGG